MNRPKKFTSSASQGSHGAKNGFYKQNSNGHTHLPMHNIWKQPVDTSQIQLPRENENKSPIQESPKRKSQHRVMDFSYEKPSGGNEELHVPQSTGDFMKGDLEAIQSSLKESLAQEFDELAADLKRELQSSLRQLEQVKSSNRLQSMSSSVTDHPSQAPQLPQSKPVSPFRAGIQKQIEQQGNLPINSPGAESQLQSKIGILEQKLLSAYKREQELEEKVNSISEKMQHDKTDLSKTLSELKKEADTKPVEKEDPFASLSSELEQVINAVNQISKPSNQPTSPQATKEENVDSADEKSDEKKQEKKNEKGKTTQKEESKDTSSSSEKKDKDTETPWFKNKLVIGGAVLLLLLLGGGGWFLLQGGSTEVDQSLLEEYLPDQAGEEATESDSQPADGEANAGETQEGEVQGVSTNSVQGRMEAAHADISYGETRWETHKNPQFGVQFDYPINSSSLIRTDLSITVIRKTGYIFKVQRIESALELDEYWKSIKARNLRYKVQETTFRELPALFLELEDITEYPGDRYLVKRDDWIYDIWYATASKHLDDDDAKRVEVMLNSFQFNDLNAYVSKESTLA